MRSVLPRPIVRCLFVVGLLLAGAPAKAGDLTFVKDPTGVGPPSQEAEFYQFTKAKDPNAAGLVNPHAVIASSYGGLAVWIAIDSTKPDATRPDVVRLDFSGKGKFAGAPTLPLTIKTDSRGQITATFGPKVFYVERDGRKVPVSVRGSYTKQKQYRDASVTITAAAEGTCTFGNATRKVRVIDRNADLVFSVTLKPPYRTYWTMHHDVMQVAGADGKFTTGGPQAYVGQPVLVGGRWYDVSLAKMKVSAKPIARQGGKVRVNAARWRCTLVGRKYFLTVSGGKDAVPVPADTYRPHEYSIFTDADPSKRCATIEGSGTAPRGKSVIVSAGKTVQLPLGSPIQATISVSKSKGSVRFDLSQTDPMGGDISTVKGEGGKTPTNPVVEVVDKAGKTIYSAKLEYG